MKSRGSLRVYGRSSTDFAIRFVEAKNGFDVPLVPIFRSYIGGVFAPEHGHKFT